MDGSFQPILDSAGQAASSGDFEAAESLLREAARLQAASLGPHHPDLASTFNNLGVVCEKTNKLVDAGQFYQQALSIASASLDSEDPLVVTSRNNFNDFCRVHGKVDAAASQPVDVAREVREPAASQATAEPANDADTVTAAPTISPMPGLGIVPGVVLALVLLGALAIWLTRTPSAPRSAQERARPSQDVSASPVVSSPKRNPSQPIATNKAAKQPVRSTEQARRETGISTSSDERPRVIEASVCQRLSITGGQWDCESVSGSAAADTLYFYTRIASPTAIRVQHRWYQNGRLRQDVDLAVQANPSTGYRTYSRQRVDAGEWRVEVATADGAVLREEQLAIP